MPKKIAPNPATTQVTLKSLQAEIDRLKALDPWHSLDSVPMDGRPVLVLLEAEHFFSRVHSATFLPNIVCVGGSFSFDAPEITHWKPLPDFFA